MDALADGVDDMTKLSYLHEPGLLHNLASRYAIDEIYVRSLADSFLNISLVIMCHHISHYSCNNLRSSQTYTGNILIAMNPFQSLSHLYDSFIMDLYKGAEIGKLSPHVFAIADAAYR